MSNLDRSIMPPPSASSWSQVGSPAPHILQDTLKKVVTQEVVEGTQIPVPNVAQFEDLACNVVVARNEGDDDMATLLRLTVRKETVNK